LTAAVKKVSPQDADFVTDAGLPHLTAEAPRGVGPGATMGVRGARPRSWGSMRSRRAPPLE
jgi:hypothetical protein